MASLKVSEDTTPPAPEPLVQEALDVDDDTFDEEAITLNMATLEPVDADGPDAFDTFRRERSKKVRVTSMDAFPELRKRSTTTDQRYTAIGNVRRTIMGQTTDDDGGGRKTLLSDSMRLVTSDRTTHSAAYAMMFAVFADAINISCTAPNYPIMTTPGAKPDSFPSVEPFGIATAQYILLGSTSIARVISSVFFGWLAMKIGSRKCTLILMLGSVVFTLGRFFTKGSFWGFTVMSFINALFGSTVAVATGYMCLVFKDKRAKADGFIGYLMATTVASRSFGGLLTLMFPSSLFLPLLPAAALNVLAFLVVYKFVLQPKLDGEEKDESEDGSSVKLDKPALANIVVGALVDNVGK